MPVPTFERSHLLRFWPYIFGLNGCVEFRVPGGQFARGDYIVRNSRESATLLGWYDDVHSFKIDAGRLREIYGYVTVNPVKPELIERGRNKLTLGKKGQGTKDSEIVCRRWIFVDIDPIRPTNTSSTVAELAEAVSIRDRIFAAHPDIKAASIWGCSGNGVWILIRVPDYPNDDGHAELVAKVLASLAKEFDTAAAHIDQKCKNASRIMCVPGTVKCKGKHSEERPWRLSTVEGTGFEPDAPTCFDAKTWTANRPTELVGTIHSGKKKGVAPHSGFAAAPFTANRGGEAPVESPQNAPGTTDAKKQAERAFAAKALRDEAEKVANAPKEGWNHQLFKSAASLYELVAAGVLDGSEVDRALIDASDRRGHTGDEVVKTLRSGAASGSANPRDLSGVGTKVERDIPDPWDTGGQDGLPIAPGGTEVDPGVEPEFFDLSDVGNGRRLATFYKHRIRYCSEQKTWMIYDGRRWQPDRTCRIEYLAKSVSGLIEAGIREDMEEDQIKRIRDWSFRSQSAAHQAAAIRMARSEHSLGIPCRADDFDRDGMLLNVRNGTLDLTTGELRPHRPEDHITRLAPVDFDPNATCPRWDQFVLEIMNDNEELVDFLGRMVGYAATGVQREHVMAVLYGGGRNGKTLFLDLISHMLGDYANGIDTELLLAQTDPQHPTGLTELEGRRFVFAEEIDESRKLAEGLVKRLTGCPTIQARKMHGNFYTIRSTHHLFLAVNHKPQIHGTDPAIWARIMPIPFEVTFDSEIKGARKPEEGLKDRLLGEASGILNWIVAGTQRWNSDGLKKPTTISKAHESYKAEMDTLGLFLAERTMVAANARIKSQILYDSYRDWCASNKHHPFSHKKFGMLLKDRGYQVSNSNSTVYRRGLILREHEHLPDVEYDDGTNSDDNHPFFNLDAE